MFNDIKNRHDIGMIHPARGQGLAVKELLRFARGRQGLQDHLQGDSLAGTFIRTGPHRRHSAAANQAINPVLPVYDLACLQDRINRVLGLGFRFPHSAPSGETKGTTARYARAPVGLCVFSDEHLPRMAVAYKHNARAQQEICRNPAIWWKGPELTSRASPGIVRPDLG